MRAWARIRLVSLLCVLATPALAQQREHRFDVPRDTIMHGGWSAVRVVKWGTLAGSTAALVYGFAQNRVADREYERIERLCQDAPAACATQPGSSAYADPELEARYQQVVRRDDRARVALLAGQLGLAAGVLLFIIDLPKTSAPDDIPYEPRPLRVSVAGGRLHAGVQLCCR